MTIKFRSAILSDSDVILQWRNHENSRKHSLNNRIIDNPEHEKWYRNRIMLNLEQPFWVFEDETSLLGYVRFDRSAEFKNVFEISICINPEFQNQGYGKYILTKSVTLHFEKYPTSKIVARVNRNNSSSINIFKRANFIEKLSLDDYLVFELVNSNLRFIFRADASTEIGAGHTQRALGLIQELIDLGYKVIFIGDTSEINWVSIQMKSLRFDKIYLKEQDFTSNSKTDILIFDTYTIPINSKFLRKSNWLLVVSVNDLSTPEYDAHIIIHPGVSENIVNRSNAKLLSGPKFVLLRKSIRRKTEKLESPFPVITVVGGGKDKTGFAHEMSKLLKLIPEQFMANFFTTSVHSIESDLRFQTFEIGPELDEIGNNSELIFCTSGSTSLEFIARGCAVGIACANLNQMQYYRVLPKLGVAKAVGVYQNQQWILDSNIIRELITSKLVRDQLSSNSSQLIDFNATKRVLDEIMTY